MSPDSEEDEADQLAEAIRRSLRVEDGEEGVPLAPPAAEPAEPEAEPPEASADVARVLARGRAAARSRTSGLSSGSGGGGGQGSGGSASSSSGAQAPGAFCSQPVPDAAQATRGGDAFVACSSVPTAPPTLLEAALRRAAEAGKHAGQKDFGSISRVPSTPPAPAGFEAKRFWVVIRPALAFVGQPITLRGLVTGPYRNVEGYVAVGNGVLSDICIFHGFATREEAEAYWAAAFPGVALPALPARRRQ